MAGSVAESAAVVICGGTARGARRVCSRRAIDARAASVIPLTRVEGAGAAIVLSRTVVFARIVLCGLLRNAGWGNVLYALRACGSSWARARIALSACSACAPCARSTRRAPCARSFLRSLVTMAIACRSRRFIPVRNSRIGSDASARCVFIVPSHAGIFPPLRRLRARCMRKPLLEMHLGQMV